MAGIFLSYRRSDSEGQAGRLYDELTGHFGQDAVFMDVAGIEAGRDFRRAIDQHVTSCGVLLAIIGKDWVSAADTNGRRRLDDPNDFVRLEVAAALKRDIPVVPVLVRGATMPQATDLPADCADLCYRNAVELTHARWNSDVQVLIKALTRYVGASQATVPPARELSAAAGNAPPPAATTQSKSRGARYWLIAMPIAMALVGGGVVAYRSSDGGDNNAGSSSQATDTQRKASDDTKSDAPPVQSPVDSPTGSPKPPPAPTTDVAGTQIPVDAGDATEPNPPKGASENRLSEWIPASQFQAARQDRPAGERFPYDIELQCVKKGENRIRARFGPPPRGVQEIRIGHFLFRGEPKLPVVEGYREFSVSQCNMPGGGQMIVRVMVRP